MHRIDAQIAGTNLADNRIEIRAVAIDEAACFMHRVRDFLHVTFEQSASIRIGDHDSCDVRSKTLLQSRQINAAFIRRWNVLNPVAGKGGRCRIGAMGTVRHQYDFACVATRLQGCANAQNTAQFAMRTRLGAHRDTVHTRQIDQPMRQLIDHLKCALHSFARLQRVHVGKTGHPSDLFIKARIVLHRARAEREKTQIDPVILTA